MMGNKLDQREVVSVEEALRTEIIVNQALIDLLVAKGIITHNELLTQIDVVKRETLAVHKM